MTDIKLVEPRLQYAEETMAYKQEYAESGETLHGGNTLSRCDTIEEWLQHVKATSNVDTCPADRTPSSTYIAIRISDNRMVGIIDIRHHINTPLLSIHGGHIGYSTRISERRKGYAKEMLRQALFKCQRMGLDKILITCNADNIGSRKTILANGGVLESVIDYEGEKLERYWIYL